VPPPRIASETGTRWTLVASRLVQGSLSRRPGMSGSTAAEPVQTATACFAVRTVVTPSSLVTVTSRGAERVAQPRTRSMPALFSHFTCPSSVQSLVM
jgi:hypothetical protein